ncbi:hypothetical protein SAY86_000955 [Trapa natans]|uniref:RING-type domain-containing protein n=1 Tax=Trapa natans TaxID=22666 RepID=A0AAN7MCX5_TRANT|nr:hypothetical protein SAY86_000955 [Trapa natans]
MTVEPRSLSHLFTCPLQPISSTRGGSDADFDAMNTREMIFPAFYQTAAAWDRNPPVKSFYSGLSTFDNGAVGSPRKRSREPIDNPYGGAAMTPRSKTRLLSVVDQQQSGLDRLVAQHINAMRLEIEEKARRQSEELQATIQRRFVSKISEKDEEMRRLAKLNLSLHERIKTLSVENQLLRRLAQTSEAVSNTLRSNLQQVLSVAQAAEDRRTGCLAAAVAVEKDSAESFCGSSSCGGGEEAAEVEKKAATMEGGGRRGFPKSICRGCGEKEAYVLLQPCRHMCLCTACGSARRGCPLCGSEVTGTIHVNMLS